MFRCLAFHREGKVREMLVKRMFNEYRQFVRLTCTAKNFKGISVANLSDFEDCFAITVNAYELVLNENHSVIPRYVSLNVHKCVQTPRVICEKF